jgi:hypothetical protein
MIKRMDAQLTGPGDAGRSAAWQLVRPVARPETRRPEVAAGILVGGAITHALLCGPAIACRGYPPIDPIWYGVTFTWPIPVVISAYFDSMRFGVRRIQLILYALVTAFFMAGTVVMVVPRNMGPGEMLVGTIFFGPLHLLITFVLEFTAQMLYSMGRRLVDRNGQKATSTFSIFSLLALFVWIGLILGIPFGYQSFVKSSVNHSAIRHAEDDWGTNAVIYRDYEFDEIGDCTVQYEFDPETGLQFKHRMADLGFADRYNARIDELLHLHGIPAYSIKSIMPKPEDLVQLLDSSEMDPVDTFSVDLTENIHLMRRGSLTRWGGTSTSGSESLAIVTPHGLMGVGDGVLPVHSKITDEIIYIRNGSDWVGAFLLDGRMIMSASR